MKNRMPMLCLMLGVLLPAVCGAQGLTFVTAWGSEGTGPGQFSWPRDIAVDDARGLVYVTDGLGDRVNVFDKNGSYIRSWGSTGTGPGQFLNPVGVAVDRSGNVYVGDGSNSSLTLPFIPRIQVFTSTGAFVTQWGSYGPAPGQLIIPIHLAVDWAGRVYVADGWDRVQVFTSSGEYLTRWGSYGTGPGEFSNASSIAVGPGGTVYVGDCYNPARVQLFTDGGALLGRLGSAEAGPGQFFQVSGVATDLAGQVYVMDRGLCCPWLDIFTSTGAFVGRAVTSMGVGNGQFRSPGGLAVDADGFIYIVDSANQRVQKFAPDITPTSGKRTSWSRVKALYR